MSKYDVLVVGSGLFGATYAQQCHQAGKIVLVIDRRYHLAGNCYTENQRGIEKHVYGAHIFRSNSQPVWEYVNRFTRMLPYRYRVAAQPSRHPHLVSFPVNLATFAELCGANNPKAAMAWLRDNCPKMKQVSCFEDIGRMTVGDKLYETLYEGYTRKMWNRSTRELSSSLFTRIPVRFTWDDSYFDDTYQGMPEHGYTAMVKNMLEGIPVELGQDYIKDKTKWDGRAKTVVYTGALDELFKYEHGALEYRTLAFKDQWYEEVTHQGVAAIHYTGLDVPHTRTIEHKHLALKLSKEPLTVVTTETPGEWKPGLERLYPIPDKKNQLLYLKYRAMSESQPNLILGGRLACFRYQNMDATCAEALAKSAKFLNL